MTHVPEWYDSFTAYLVAVAKDSPEEGLKAFGAVSYALFHALGTRSLRMTATDGHVDIKTDEMPGMPAGLVIDAELPDPS